MRIASCFRTQRLRTVRRIALGALIAGCLLATWCGALSVAGPDKTASEDPAGDTLVATDQAAAQQPVAPEQPAGVAVEADSSPAADPSAKSAASADSRPQPPQVETEPATFNGAQPGKTTAQELETLWGKPKGSTEVDDETVQQQFAVAPFEQITVTLVNDVLTSIVIQLDKAFPPGPLAKELQLSDITPVHVSDELGEPLGLAFPERGVIFTFVSGQKDPLVAQILVEKIDAQPFVLRAERHARTRYRANLADLELALQLDPDCVRAYALKARILYEVGSYPESRTAIAAAVQREPQNPEYRLLQARIWEQLGEGDQALEETRAALGLATSQLVWKAAALAQLGDQVAAGPDRDYKQAAMYHQQAIRIAQTLVKDRRVAVRRVARQVLLDAHLAMANDIAWGNWKNKTNAVTQWLKRSEKLVEDGEKLAADVANERFQLCQDALAAYVGLQGKLDPTHWAEATMKQGQELIQAADDPLTQQRLRWELGMAFYDALQVYHMRRQHAEALTYGEKAVSYLEEAVAARDPIPGQSYLMGRLYFRLGSIHAVQQKDHAQAIPWFEKAVPLMEEPIPHTAMADIGRQGETFISMAVSYWEVGQTDEALRLTQQGLKLVEQAVEEETLDRSALAIPYNNLADMHRQLGNDDKAKSYAEMAAQIQSQKRR